MQQIGQDIILYHFVYYLSTTKLRRSLSSNHTGEFHSDNHAGSGICNYPEEHYLPRKATWHGTRHLRCGGDLWVDSQTERDYRKAEGAIEWPARVSNSDTAIADEKSHVRGQEQKRLGELQENYGSPAAICLGFSTTISRASPSTT